MKALPLWQPWATLVALGVKRVETRSWATPPALIGERIAIHATKTTQELRVCRLEPFSLYVPNAADLPLGALVATAVIDRCRAVTQQSADALEELKPEEFAFGNYAPGRFAWVLRDVEALATPVPFTGRQGMFDVPDEILTQTTMEVADAAH